MDPAIDAHARAYAEADDAFVERAFREIVRRPPEQAAVDRMLGKLADGTLSRATLLHELVTSVESRRVRELDDAIALGLAGRSRNERLTWLQAPAGTDERVIEIPWVLSRVRSGGRVLEVGYAFAEAAYIAALLRCEVELVGLDLATRELDGVELVTADVRSIPLPDASVDQVLLVSTLEHVGADNTVYGIAKQEHESGAARHDALVELRRILRSDGNLLVTVPLGEPGDHGWFRHDDVAGWTSAFTRAGFFVEEQEAYELDDDGWRAAPAFSPTGVRYGERGPAASAVLCTTLTPGRLRRLLTPSGAATTLKRRTRAQRHRG